MTKECRNNSQSDNETIQILVERYKTLAFKRQELDTNTPHYQCASYKLRTELALLYSQQNIIQKLTALPNLSDADGLAKLEVLCLDSGCLLDSKLRLKRPAAATPATKLLLDLYTHQLQAG